MTFWFLTGKYTRCPAGRPSVLRKILWNPRTDLSRHAPVLTHPSNAVTDRFINPLTEKLIISVCIKLMPRERLSLLTFCQGWSPPPFQFLKSILATYWVPEKGTKCLAKKEKERGKEWNSHPKELSAQGLKQIHWKTRAFWGGDRTICCCYNQKCYPEQIYFFSGRKSKEGSFSADSWTYQLQGLGLQRRASTQQLVKESFETQQIALGEFRKLELQLGGKAKGYKSFLSPRITQWLKDAHFCSYSWFSPVKGCEGPKTAQ